MTTSTLPHITQRVKTSTDFHNPFALLAALTSGASVRCARCQHLVHYEQIAMLRSKRRRPAIAICRQCAKGGAR